MTKQEMELILAVEGDFYTENYRGCKIEVIRHPSLLHLNGYISFPSGNISKRCIDTLFCHGGITYEEEDNGKIIIGFDTAHLGDLSPCYFFMPLLGLKSNLGECRSIVEQVKLYNRREEDKRKRMSEKIKELEKLMKEISEDWEDIEDTEFIDEDYPFRASFDEVVSNVSYWADSIEEKLES